MWRVQSLEKQEVTLDFSSAGLGKCNTSALVGDKTTLVNATTAIEIEADGCVQVLVCQSCGIVRCEPGGWVQPRRFGDAIVWLPCFARLAELRTEYRPPDFLVDRGIPLFVGSQTQLLGQLLPLFRAEVTPVLQVREVALLTQWTAPYRVLGNPGDVPRIHREVIIAASAGELSLVLDQLQAALDDALSNASPAVPVPAKAGPDLYLDGGKNSPIWTPLVTDNVGKLRLSFDGVGIAADDPG